MFLDDKYKKYMWHYRTGRCSGPAEYTFKKHGFRLIYGENPDICGVCGKHETHWFILYFDPKDRFKDWNDRKIYTQMICSVEDIDLFLSRVLMEKVSSLL